MSLEDSTNFEKTMPAEPVVTLQGAVVKFGGGVRYLTSSVLCIDFSPGRTTHGMAWDTAMIFTRLGYYVKLFRHRNRLPAGSWVFDSGGTLCRPYACWVPILPDGEG